MHPVDFLTSLGHYGAHTAPLWHALDPAERGTWWAPDAVRRDLLDLGVDRRAIRHGRPRQPGTPCVVASAADAALSGDRPVVLVEHGAGQAYDVVNPSYSGGPKRQNVVLFLCPNEVVAARNAATYPDAAVEVVGSPRLDALMYLAAGEGDGVASPLAPTVALSHHWDCPLVPETRWAWPAFKREYPRIVERWHTIGHGHPRFAAAFANRWGELGVEHVPEFVDVVRRAQLYVCDNSSSLYEWAALGRPVVVLDAPWYRRELDAWPRFWRCADVGVRCGPGDLEQAIERALVDPPDVAERRSSIVDEVFPLRDGKAAQRSVDALRRVLD